MSDIVERLRQELTWIICSPEHKELLQGAKSEIERLRFELKAAHNEIEIADYVIEQSKAENAKLRAVLEKIARIDGLPSVIHFWIVSALTQQDKR